MIAELLIGLALGAPPPEVCVPEHEAEIAAWGVGRDLPNCQRDLVLDAERYEIRIADALEAYEIERRTVRVETVERTPGWVVPVLGVAGAIVAGLAVAVALLAQ